MTKTTEDRRAVHLTEQQIDTIKTVLRLMQEAYVKHEHNTHGADALVDDAYRAMSVELIQRIPSPGDRWRGLSDHDLRAVMAALLHFEGATRSDERVAPERDRLARLYDDAAREWTRRGHEPAPDRERFT